MLGIEQARSLKTCFSLSSSDTVVCECVEYTYATLDAAKVGGALKLAFANKKN